MSKAGRFFRVSFVLVCALLLLASVGFAAETKASPDVTPEGSVSDQAMTDPERVLAKVGDVEIKVKDVEEVIASLDPQRAAFFNSPLGRGKVVEQLINRNLFYLYGKELKVDQGDEFKAELEKIRREMMSHFALQKALDEIKISDEEIKKYYDEHKAEFVVPESIRASHILVASEDKAKEIVKEIKDGKITFEAAAVEYSSCPSKEASGDLGFFGKGQMVPEFENAAFALKKDGDMSDPVQSQFGWHIIRLTERKDSTQKPLDEVKEQIQQIIAGERQRKVYEDKLAELKKTYKVQTF